MACARLLLPRCFSRARLLLAPALAAFLARAPLLSRRARFAVPGIHRALARLRFPSPALARFGLHPAPLPSNPPSPSPRIQTLSSSPNSYQISVKMNPLRPPSRQGKAGRGSGAPVTLNARSIDAAPAAPADGSSPPGEPSAVPAATTAPSLASLRAAGFPEWWTSSSPLVSNPGIYPQGGFTNFLNSNNSSENFHLVGNTRGSSTISPTSLKRTRPVESNAHEKETIVLDADESKEDERTERRLNYTKDEDVRLASAWLLHSKDPVEGTDRTGDQYWSVVTKEYNKGTEVSRRRNRNQLKIRWDRIKKLVMEFHGCWVSTTRVYRSGYSDDQLMDMAEKMLLKPIAIKISRTSTFGRL